MANVFQCSKGEYQLFHARSYYCHPNSRSQGITVVLSHAEQDLNVVILAISVCSKDDSYSKKLGHKLARENLEAGDFFMLPRDLWNDLDQFTSYDKQYLEAVVRKLCLLNLTRNLFTVSEKCKRQIEYLAHAYYYPLPQKRVEEVDPVVEE